MSAFIAIVGRPNVGKSALFNRMLRLGGSALKSAAITESTPGVTRDRNYGEAEWEGRRLTIIDTGGFYAESIPGESREIVHQVREQAMFAVEEADLIIHLLDSKEGLNPADMELAAVLRSSGKRVLWVANKIDTPAKETRVLEFYQIGADEIVPVSAITGLGFEELMDKVIALLPPEIPAAEGGRETGGLPKIAVVGRPNVGKSTLINSLLGKKRLIVSPIPGTTRDAIDSVCTYYGRKYLFIDTAGIRKKATSYSVEGFSVIRAVKSIERADVAIIVLDASAGIVEQDQKIAGLVEEYGKGAIFLINKWDLVEDPEKMYKKLSQELRRTIWFMDYAPFLTISGIQKKRTTKIFSLIDEIIPERRKRIPTSELNKFLPEAVSARPLPRYKGKEAKFYYITQIDIEPPTFTVFTNLPSAVKEHYLRYLEKAIRGKYSFKGTPIRIYAKSR